MIDEENPTGNIQFRLWDAGKPPFQFLESVQLKISEGCSGEAWQHPVISTRSKYNVGKPPGYRNINILVRTPLW